MHIPKRIAEIIKGKPYTLDQTGKSGSSVMIFDDMVLKTDRESSLSDDSVKIMKWLEGRLPVPEVIAYEKENGMSYLLMTKIKGEMSCDEYYLEHTDELIPLLAEAIKMLQSIDISGCPIEQSLERELKEARKNVEEGRVDIFLAQPDTFGEKGFKGPYELLEWLENNKPSCEPVFSHGDLCLPNIFIKDGRISGFIDLGSAGAADKWRDISLCFRSLKNNTNGFFGGKVYDADPDRLFDALGIAPDYDRLRYWILLDELF